MYIVLTEIDRFLGSADSLLKALTWAEQRPKFETYHWEMVIHVSLYDGNIIE